MLRAGAHLLANPAPPTPARQPVVSDRPRHVGDVQHDARTLGCAGAAFGRQQPHRETVHAAFPLKDECVAVRVVEPVFVDPEGRRARG